MRGLDGAEILAFGVFCFFVGIYAPWVWTKLRLRRGRFVRMRVLDTLPPRPLRGEREGGELFIPLRDPSPRPRSRVHG